MKVLNHKIFRCFFFVLLLNLESLVNSSIPSIITIAIQLVCIALFLYYFLPISYRKTAVKNPIIAKHKPFLVILLIVVLNMEQVISKWTISILHLLISILLTLFLVYILLPLWYKNDRMDSNLVINSGK